MLTTITNEQKVPLIVPDSIDRTRIDFLIEKGIDSKVAHVDLKW